MDTTEHISQEKEKENDSIKLNLQKSFFTFRDERAVLLDKLEAAKKAKNLLRFGNNDASQLAQATEEKKRLETDLTKLEESFQMDFRGFLEEFSKQTVKWIILIYNDKLDSFMKSFIIEISKELDLQIKEEKMRLFIARKGKSMADLIEITKKEANQASKANKEKEKSIPEQQINEKKEQEKAKEEQEKREKEAQEKKRQRQNEINESINASSKPSQQTNQTVVSQSEKKDPTEIKPQQVAQPTQPKSQTNEAPKKQAENNQNPSINSNSKNVGKQEANQQQQQPLQQQGNKKDTNKDQEKINNKKSGQVENKDDKNNKKTQENDPKKKSKEESKQKQPEEDIRIEDLIKQPFKTESQRVEELLKETAEEQKAMDEDDIIQMIRTAADSVNEYQIVSMDENYNLTIQVVEPDFNSFPFFGYELYLVREHSYKDLMEMALSDLQALDKILLSNSTSPNITLNLMEAVKLDQENKYIQKVNRNSSVLFFAVVALTKEQQGDQPETFSSKIQTIFRINLPNIIPQKTSFQMTGSLNLIAKDFFKDPDVFEGNLSINSQALKVFLPLDSSDVFSLCQPQAVSIRKSVLLLLKSGQVLQWGEVVAFEGNKKEYILEEDDEQMLSLLTYTPYCPVDHPLVFTKISQGDHHYVGVSIDGQVYTWGLNVFGELGHSNYTCLPEPKRVMYFSENNIFIVDVKCGEHFTVCLSVDGKLYTFGSQQAPDGQEIKDNYDNVINYENKGISQPVPRQVDCLETVTEFSCGEDHCIFLTKQGSCYVWGDNSSQQIISNGHLQFFGNFVHPVKVVPMNDNSFIFKLIACSNVQNFAVLKHITTGEEICVAWGGKQNEWLDIRKNRRYFAKVTDFHEIIVRDNSLFAINSEGQIFGSGSNFEYKLGISKQQDEAQVALPPQTRVHSAGISALNSSGIIISKN